MKFLIDECLSPKLAEHAHQEGYGESSHVVWLGRSGIKDWDLAKFAADGDWVLVTRNAVDFRGDKDEPGNKGQYAALDLHAGLICLNCAEPMSRSIQISLFREALAEVRNDPDLVNQVVEVTLDNNGDLLVRRYGLPPA